ncbi:DUF6531 domain-containing protein, partial [Salmonella enterica subsp. enterica serovar Virginia]|nr:DUF6531 domain-containing protein [Salmonella enterica subsp. enterica serovar Virginia]
HIHRIAEQPADSLTHGHPGKLPADKLSGTFSAKFRPQLCRLPVTCSRFYANHLETVGLLGRGWRLNWETSLRDDDEHITLT